MIEITDKELEVLATLETHGQAATFLYLLALDKLGDPDGTGGDAREELAMIDDDGRGALAADLCGILEG